MTQNCIGHWKGDLAYGAMGKGYEQGIESMALGCCSAWCCSFWPCLFGAGFDWHTHGRHMECMPHFAKYRQNCICPAPLPRVFPTSISGRHRYFDRSFLALRPISLRSSPPILSILRPDQMLCVEESRSTASLANVLSSTCRRAGLLSQPKSTCCLSIELRTICLPSPSVGTTNQPLTT